MRAPKGIVIYGVGNVGCGLTRLAAERGWPVVAAVNRPGFKVGHRLSGLAGCTLSRDPVVHDNLQSALRGVAADIALVGVGDSLADYMDIYRACMERRLNVITASVEASYPKAVSPKLAAEIDMLARANGVVFNGSGFPDIFRIGLIQLLAGASTRIERITHRSLVDIGPHGAEVARLSGTGLSEKAFRAAFDPAQSGRVPFYQVLNHHAVEAAGLTVRSIGCTIEPVPARALRTHRGIDVPVGHALGSRMTTRIETAEGFEVVGLNEIRLAVEGEEDFLEWRIEGPSPVAARLTGYDAGMATVTQMINRIPGVLAAEPGLRTTAELGPPRFLGAGA
jgi:4-hydroxy-tetrahydrodipicolinate reductase